MPKNYCDKHSHKTFGQFNGLAQCTHSTMILNNWTCLFRWQCQMKRLCLEWKALATSNWPNLPLLPSAYRGKKIKTQICVVRNIDCGAPPKETYPIHKNGVSCVCSFGHFSGRTDWVGHKIFSMPQHFCLRSVVSVCVCFWHFPFFVAVASLTKSLRRPNLQSITSPRTMSLLPLLLYFNGYCFLYAR